MVEHVELVVKECRKSVEFIDKWWIITWRYVYMLMIVIWITC